MAFKDRLIAAMGRAGVDQSELARRVGVTSSAVNQWVNSGGQPKFSRIQDIAKALGVSPNYLIKGDDAEVAPPEYPERAPGGDSVGFPDERPKSVEHTLLLMAWDRLNEVQRRMTIAYMQSLLRFSGSDDPNDTSHRRIPSSVNEP